MSREPWYVRALAWVLWFVGIQRFLDWRFRQQLARQIGAVPRGLTIHNIDDEPSRQLRRVMHPISNDERTGVVWIELPLRFRAERVVFENEALARPVAGFDAHDTRVELFRDDGGGWTFKPHLRPIRRLLCECGAQQQGFVIGFEHEDAPT